MINPSKTNQTGTGGRDQIPVEKQRRANPNHNSPAQETIQQSKVYISSLGYDHKPRHCPWVGSSLPSSYPPCPCIEPLFALLLLHAHPAHTLRHALDTLVCAVRGRRTPDVMCGCGRVGRLTVSLLGHGVLRCVGSSGVGVLRHRVLLVRVRLSGISLTLTLSLVLGLLSIIRVPLRSVLLLRQRRTGADPRRSRLAVLTRRGLRRIARRARWRNLVDAGTARCGLLVVSPRARLGVSCRRTVRVRRRALTGYWVGRLSLWEGLMRSRLGLMLLLLLLVFLLILLLRILLRLLGLLRVRLLLLLLLLLRVLGVLRVGVRLGAVC